MKALKMKIRNLSKKDFKKLKELCQNSKNLYNQSILQKKASMLNKI